MTQQFLRALSLVVGNASEAYELSDLHVRFQVKNANVQTLKSAVIRIYNLTPTLAKLIQNEFTSVRLSSGYQGSLGMIFQGELTQIERGKENATDSYVEIHAQDGDKAFNWGTSSWSLAKGYTPDDLYSKLLKDLEPYGMTMGYKPNFIGNPSVDGFTCHGMTRDLLRNLAKSQGCTWSIEDGKLDFTPFNGVIPGTVPSLNSASGLLGTPRQTIEGLIARSLLNPAIRAGGQVNIDNAAITTLRLTDRYQKADFVPSLDNDGAYKAFQVVHTGDNRGQAWYTDMICVAVDGTSPLSSTFTTAVPDGQ
jgi:hypothetical protein